MSVRNAVALKQVGAGGFHSSSGASVEIDLTSVFQTDSGKKARYLRVESRQVTTTANEDGACLLPGVAGLVGTDPGSTGIMTTFGHPVVIDVQGYDSLYVENVTGGTNVSLYLTPVEPVFE